ncbi:MAG: hypothetical protein MOB07_23635 [Acidobacteria bacterium]|nr:hypothetical protein [Acidobacteriota bacterium]
MLRRNFLLGAGALVTSQIAFVNKNVENTSIITLAAIEPKLYGPIRKLNRINREVLSSDAGTGVKITGWELELDERISWDLVAWNPGPKMIRYSIAQQFSTNWKYIKDIDVPAGTDKKVVYSWKPTNEDQFFVAHILNPSGWSQISGDRPNSNGGLHQGDTVCHMSWNTPQELHLQVQRTP